MFEYSSNDPYLLSNMLRSPTYNLAFYSLLNLVYGYAQLFIWLCVLVVWLYAFCLIVLYLYLLCAICLIISGCVNLFYENLLFVVM